MKLSLKILPKKYALEEFINTILLLKLPPYSRIKILCYFTQYENWIDGNPNLIELLKKNGVMIEDFGEIKKLTAFYVDSRTQEKVEIVFYTRLNPDAKILYCITIASMTGINYTLDRIARNSRGFYFLPIGVYTFNLITNFLLQSDKNTKCTYFSATHSPWSTIEGEVRSRIDRTTIYYGFDGFQSLEELKSFYGVLPKTIRYDVPDYGIFEIKNSGCFTLMGEKIEVESRRMLLKLSEIAIKDVLVKKEVIDAADFSIIPIETESRIIRIPKSTPWIYKFSKELKDEYLDLLINGLIEDEFTLFNYTTFEGGSFILSGMVYDEIKNNIFTIHVDNSKIIVAPSKTPQFDSFLRFYETLEYFDPEGVVQAMD